VIQKRGKRSDRMSGGVKPRRFVIAVAVAVVCQIAFLSAYQTILAEHYAWRAQNAAAAKKPQYASAWAKRSLAVNPHQGYAAFFAGLTQSGKDQTTATAQVFQRALRTMAHRAQPLRELASCEEKSGDHAEAARHLAEALAIEPIPTGNPATPRAELGRLLFGLGRWADGIVQFRMAAADAPASRVGFDGLAVGYQHFGALEPAVASAFALLGSPQHVARASTHLSRLWASAAQKPLIVAVLKEMQSALQAADPRRSTIEDLMKTAVAGQ